MPVRRLLALVLVLTACDPGDGPAETSGLDPDVAPVTEGDRYRPPPDVTWQWQLSGALNAGYDVDLYDVDLWETPEATLRQLQDRGVAVLCYFSAGSSDPDRPDFGQFAASDLGRPLGGFQRERWLDVRSQTVWDVMLERLDLAQSVGATASSPTTWTATPTTPAST